MPKIILSAKLEAPAPFRGLDLGLKKWAKHSKKRLYKMKSNISKHSQELDKAIKGIGPSLPGRLFQKAQDNYLSNVRKALRPRPRQKVTRFHKGLHAGKANYKKSRLEYYYPLFGSNKYKVKGLIFLAIMALTGDKRLAGCMKNKSDKITTGGPVCIVSRDRRTEFTNMLKSELGARGWAIIKSACQPETVRTCNEGLNRAINNYILSEIEPFSSGGDSHIDFVVIEIDGKKRLGLDIKVALEK